MSSKTFTVLLYGSGFVLGFHPKLHVNPVPRYRPYHNQLYQLMWEKLLGEGVLAGLVEQRFDFYALGF